MTAPALGDTRFGPGGTVVRRGLHLGREWSDRPCRALADTGAALRPASWPGICSLAPSTCATALGTGDDADRAEP
ncbi:hypothetical protein [Kitasatospora sp. NPDC002965]|uniref:hypothetical protein n=1 Tax=Kitasatospora sp. NPDC002965 TaxID=3154775 RepID=UPI0033A85C6F